MLKNRGETAALLVVAGGVTFLMWEIFRLDKQVVVLEKENEILRSGRHKDIMEGLDKLNEVLEKKLKIIEDRNKS